MRKYVRLVTAFFSAAALAVLCVTASAAGGAQAGPIVIGMPVALTGAINFFDGPFYNGARLAVTDINKHGGVLGRQLKIVTSDTKSQIPQGTEAAQQVISEGAQFILPTVDFTYGGAATHVAIQHNLIAISQVGDPRYGLLGPTVYNMFPQTPTLAADSYAFINKMGWKHVYLLNDTSLTYTMSECSFLKQLLGSKFAGESSFQNSDTSIATQISQIKASNQDAIFLCSYPPGGATAAREIRSAGLKGPIFGDITMEGTYWSKSDPGENNFYALAGGVVRGNDPVPARRTVMAEYKAAYGTPTFSTAVLSGYSAVQAIAIAVKQAGSTDTAAVEAQLNKFKNVALAQGPTTFTPKCHAPIARPYAVVKFQHGSNIPYYQTTVTPGKLPSNEC